MDAPTEKKRGCEASEGTLYLVPAETPTAVPGATPQSSPAHSAEGSTLQQPSIEASRGLPEQLTELSLKATLAFPNVAPAVNSSEVEQPEARPIKEAVQLSPVEDNGGQREASCSPIPNSRLLAGQKPSGAEQTPQSNYSSSLKSADGDSGLEGQDRGAASFQSPYPSLRTGQHPPATLFFNPALQLHTAIPDYPYFKKSRLKSTGDKSGELLPISSMSALDLPVQNLCDALEKATLAPNSASGNDVNLPVSSPRSSRQELLSTNTSRICSKPCQSSPSTPANQLLGLDKLVEGHRKLAAASEHDQRCEPLELTYDSKQRRSSLAASESPEETSSELLMELGMTKSFLRLYTEAHKKDCRKGNETR